MAEIKELRVTLKDAAEEAVLMGGKRPRRPRTRKQRGGAGAGAEGGPDALPESGRVQDEGGSLSPMAAAVAEGPVARIEKIESGGPPVGVQSDISGEGRGAPLIGGGSAAVASLGPIMDRDAPSPLAAGLTGSPSVVRASLSGTTVVGGGPAPVVIGGKRGAGTVSTVPVAKILPSKRRLTDAPAAVTHKKPKFKVGDGGEGSGALKTEQQPGVTAPTLGGAAGGARGAAPAVKQTRRFKERKIKLTVKSSRVAKAIRHKVKARIRAMPLVEVRKVLLKKGIIKAAAAEKLPEAMLRNMLRDYMLLHNAE